MKRREAREKILQILYQVDLAKTEVGEAITSVLEEEGILQGDVSFIEDRVNGTYNHLNKIDENISKYLKGWSLDRLPYVDRTILRMAAYELMFTHDVSVKVVLNEAVELAKTFGTSDSAKYINGVLGAMVKDNPV